MLESNMEKNKINELSIEQIVLNEPFILTANKLNNFINKLSVITCTFQFNRRLAKWLIEYQAENELLTTKMKFNFI